MFNFAIIPPHPISPPLYGRDGSGRQPLTPARISGVVAGGKSISMCNTM